MKKLGVVLGCMALMAQMALAGTPGGMKMGTTGAPSQFNRLKQLVGTWTGPILMVKGKPTQFTVTYSLISGGSAVMERESCPAMHEDMMSVYYVDSNKHLVMTHYCMLGNQPHLTLVKSAGNTLSFEMQGVSGIASAQEEHMHRLDLTFVDANHLTAAWTEYNHDKAAGVEVFHLTRKS